MTKFLIISGQNIFGFEYKGLVFCRNNSLLMENMDKKPTVPKWVLLNRPKIPKMPQKFSAQFVWPRQKFGLFEKSSLWVSVVRARQHHWWSQFMISVSGPMIYGLALLVYTFKKGGAGGRLLTVRPTYCLRRRRQRHRRDAGHRAAPAVCRWRI